MRRVRLNGRLAIKMPTSKKDLEEGKRLVEHLSPKQTEAALVLSMKIMDYTQTKILLLISQGFSPEEAILVAEAALALSLKGTNMGIRTATELGII